MGDPIQESPVFCPCSFSLSACVACLTSTLTQCPTGTTNPTHTQPQATLEELQKEIANDGSRGTFGTPCGSKRTLSDYEKVQQLQRAGLTAPRWARQDADDVQRAKTKQLGTWSHMLHTERPLLESELALQNFAYRKARQMPITREVKTHPHRSVTGRLGL